MPLISHHLSPPNSFFDLLFLSAPVGLSPFDPLPVGCRWLGAH
ncbi:hypothetical protein TNCV_1896901, partial [Trichonephila clavipes]